MYFFPNFISPVIIYSIGIIINELIIVTTVDDANQIILETNKIGMYNAIENINLIHFNIL